MVKQMLFRPSFCANCGERIDRPEWFPWTSRRFCQVCEIEFKGQDLIPRIIVGLGIIVGLFGVGGYLKSDVPRYEQQALKQARRIDEPLSPPTKVEASVAPVPRNESANSAVSGQLQRHSLSSTPITQDKLSSAGQKRATDEPIYYCSAETKKGTPCSRRVRANTRCYQHIGMPAMVSAEKLSVK